MAEIRKECDLLPSIEGDQWTKCVSRLCASRFSKVSSLSFSVLFESVCVCVVFFFFYHKIINKSLGIESQPSIERLF